MEPLKSHSQGFIQAGPLAVPKTGSMWKVVAYFLPSVLGPEAEIVN
jgi:hypothetical protein